MRWLITRPAPDAEALAKRLAEMGQDSVSSPVLRRVACAHDPIDCDRYSALIFTSRNGVLEGTANQDLPAGLPVFTVGDATAAAARAAGFTSVISAHGHVDNLADCIARHFSNRKMGRPEYPLMHICGQENAGDLVATLGAKGIASEKTVVYAMMAEPSLTPEALNGLELGTLHGAILLSPRTARLFAQLLTRAGLSPLPERFIFAVISSSVAPPLQSHGGQVRIAKRPTLEWVLELLV